MLGLLGTFFIFYSIGVTLSVSFMFFGYRVRKQVRLFHLTSDYSELAKAGMSCSLACCALSFSLFSLMLAAQTISVFIKSFIL